jgi:hypothetical protein
VNTTRPGAGLSSRKACRSALTPPVDKYPRAVPDTTIRSCECHAWRAGSVRSYASNYRCQHPHRAQHSTWNGGPAPIKAASVLPLSAVCGPPPPWGDRVTIRHYPPRQPKLKTAARGYGSAHQTLRAGWTQRVAAGGVRCARCGLPIAPGEPWDLGHDDYDRRIWTGPEHRRCNRATSGRVRRSRIW